MIFVVVVVPNMNEVYKIDIFSKHNNTKIMSCNYLSKACLCSMQVENFEISLSCTILNYVRAYCCDFIGGPLKMHNMKSTYVLGKFINYARKSNQNFTKVSMYFFGSAADPMVLKMISWYSNNGHLSYSETDVGTPIITRVRVPNKEKLCCVWKNQIEYKYVLVLWRRSVLA